MWWLANSKRDTEKQREPFPVSEFYLYGAPSQDGAAGPPAAAGAAMLALLDSDQFPGYALAFHDDLERAGKGEPRPGRLALIADDAILLAPRQGPDGWSGFLIMERTAAGQSREFTSDDGAICCALTVPAPESVGAVTAVESACLTTP